jgi:tetratricopeptide (TPR) repeat protein
VPASLLIWSTPPVRISARISVTTYTRQELKQDKFVSAAKHGYSWMDEHRGKVIAAIIAVVVVAGLIIGGVVWQQTRSEHAANAFGEALSSYSAPIRPAGTPPDPTVESYGSTQERAKAANAAFLAVAQKYPYTTDGNNAEYYAGVTYSELGQNSDAEAAFNKTISHGSAGLAALAKLALASLYHATNRDPQAIATLQDLIAHPTTTVPANLAQLQLASLYQANGKTAEARKIWAQIKDSDKTGTAGQIATQQLGGK